MTLICRGSTFGFSRRELGMTESVPTPEIGPATESGPARIDGVAVTIIRADEAAAFAAALRTVLDREHLLFGHVDGLALGELHLLYRLLISRR